MLTYIGFVWKPVFTEIHQYNKEFFKKEKKEVINIHVWEDAIMEPNEIKISLLCT